MAYAPRLVIAEAYYHVYNRGNRKEPIFHGPQDYERFLWAMSDAAVAQEVMVGAYCLMPNHYHLLVQPKGGGSLEKMVQSFSVSYAKYFNRRYGLVGHLFQGRYGARYIRSNEDLVNISRYIHRNPIELAKLEEYEWSSYRAYLGEPNRFCDPSLVVEVFGRPGTSYKTFCETPSISEIPGGENKDPAA